MREPRVAHVAPGRVVHLRLLQVELRRREAVEIADMVVVQVRQDHVLHRIAVDADQLQRLDRIAQMRAPALLRDLRGEARVDDEGALGPFRDPEEVVHRHRRIVRIAADEMIRTPRLAHRVADREQLVLGQLVHQCSKNARQGSAVDTLPRPSARTNCLDKNREEKHGQGTTIRQARPHQGVRARAGRLHQRRRLRRLVGAARASPSATAAWSPSRR